MSPFDLTPEEQAVLAEVLESYLSDLRMEIFGTDLLDVRTMLKERERVVTKARDALRRTGAK